MKENNLLASVALFSALYNKENYSNISDILAEFIKGAVISERKWTINSTELTHLLEKVYEFKIPESVIRTTVRNRLKDVIKIEQGHYVFDSSIENEFTKHTDNYNSILDIQNNIIENLIEFIESRVNSELSTDEKSIIVQNFKNYILDSGSSEKYSKPISAFLIKNKNDATFTQNLNLIREGVILYQGIRFTADLNELGKWNTELTIFLSTEHLFNALGYNGSLYKQIFDDFYTLVIEINSGSKNKNGEKLVELKYLQETREQVDFFFQTAEYILKGTTVLDPSKTAMKTILEGCKSPSDVKAKRVKFDMDLKQKGILYKDFGKSIYSYPDFVVEDETVIETLKKEATENQRLFDENLCRQFLQIFTKINYYRGGESKTKFENIGCILITGNGYALHLAHQTKVKFKDDDIPFAKDIDFITNKFWFKLKKGFGDKQFIPKSFDVITKAQVVLSAQLNQSVFREFNNLQKQFKDGTLSKEEALERSYVLREKSTTPEQVTPENIDTSLEFLNSEQYFEDYYREKEKKEEDLIQAINERDRLKKELEGRDEIEKNKIYEAKQAQYEIERDNYISQKWKEYCSKNWRNFIYFLYVFLMTFLPIFITLFLKGNRDANKSIENLGSKQNWIWIGLAIIFVSELLGRSYLFNKERMKAGWRWIITIINRRSYKELKKTTIMNFGNDFEQNSNNK